MTQDMIKDKISKMQTMTSSIDTVSDKIDTVTSQRSTSLTCSEFVDLVTSFSSICDDVSQITTIESLESEIDNSSVSSCSSTEMSSLTSLKTSISVTKQGLEDLIESYQAMLSTSTSTQATSGKKNKIVNLTALFCN